MFGCARTLNKGKIFKRGVRRWKLCHTTHNHIQITTTTDTITIRIIKTITTTIMAITGIMETVGRR